VNNLQKFLLRLEEPFFENYSEPPEDPLGELSEFELGIRRFCFECNHKVSLEIGDEAITVFLDPDICMILEEMPSQVAELSKGKEMEILFAESCSILINLKPLAHEISGAFQNWGYSDNRKYFKLDKSQVVGALKDFIDEVMQMAVDKGYITPEQKQEFMMPMNQRAIA